MGTVLRAAAFTGMFLPRSLRDTTINIPANEYFELCAMDKSIAKNPLCKILLLFAEAGCLDQVAYTIMLMADPTSEGNITVTKQGIEVHANYLSTKDDIEGLGALGRSSFNTFTSMRGPSAPQQPCDNKKDPNCAVSSCPDIFSLLNEFLATTMEKLYPQRAGDLSYLKDPPPSAGFPHFIEWGINQGMTNYELGKLMSTYNIGTHHMAGTARIGSVIDTKFQVKGTSGLYVVDGSALPRTTRVTPWPLLWDLEGWLG
jgi:GMC oxidoreductase